MLQAPYSRVEMMRIRSVGLLIAVSAMLMFGAL